MNRVTKKCASGVALVFGCTCMALGCGEGEGRGDDGVREGWEVSRIPTVSFGVVEGSPDQVFGKIVGVELLSDGRVVVLDGQACDLRWFGPDGGMRTRAGGVGDGPGEFRRVGSLQRLAGDTIAVFDAGAGRLTVFDPTGALVRTVSLEGGTAAAAYGLADGRIVAIGSIQPTWGDPPRTGLKREPVRVAWYGSDGRDLGVDETVPGADVYVVWTAEPSGRVLGLAPFGRWTTLVVQGRRYVLATGDSDTLKVVDTVLGDTAHVVLPRRDRRITTEMVRRYESSQGSGTPRFPYPEYHPPYSRVLLADDELWLADYAHPQATATEWFAFDLKTGLSHTVRVPSGLDLRSIRGDRVVGIRADALGVERVEVHEIRRRRDVQ